MYALLRWGFVNWTRIYVLCGSSGSVHEYRSNTTTNAELDHFNSFQYWRDPIPEVDEEDMGLSPMMAKKDLDYTVVSVL